MLKGVEYAHSKQKRLFDLAIAYAGTPAFIGMGVLYRQERVGQNGRPFSIKKFQTLQANSEPITERMAQVRRLGLDEVGQLDNVLTGEMSIVGRRPLIYSEFEEFMDNVDPGTAQQWREIVLPTKPGIVSTYGIGFHIGYDAHVDQFLERAESDIKDVIDSSLQGDVRMLMGLGSTAVFRKFK
jgi:putative colanic acid biosynthesis UDP-glucose lipid carrier transferase